MAGAKLTALVCKHMRMAIHGTCRRLLTENNVEYTVKGVEILPPMRMVVWFWVLLEQVVWTVTTRVCLGLGCHGLGL